MCSDSYNKEVEIRFLWIVYESYQGQVTPHMTGHP